MRRMDRYNDEISNDKPSRSDRNKELYQNVGTNTRYTNLTDVTNSNAIDITDTVNNGYKTREDYQKMKKYSSDISTPKVKKDLEEFNNVYKHENRVYDINNVLEEARKNRQEDDLEEKRKLKNTSYNILANLNKEELEKYRQEKRDRLTKGEDELRELIDTIASKTLAGELEAASDLLSDLMATSILDKVEKPIPDDKKQDADDEVDDDEPVRVVIETEEIILEPEREEKEEDDIIENKVLNKEEIETIRKLNEELDKQEVDIDEEKEQQEIDENKENQLEEDNNKDSEFYTRSMDLSEEDSDLEEEFKDKKTPLFVKILIFIIIAAAVAVSIYFFK